MNKSFEDPSKSQSFLAFLNPFQLAVAMSMDPPMTSVPMKENVLAKTTMLETSVTVALMVSLAFPIVKAVLAMPKDLKAPFAILPESVLAKLTSKATVVMHVSLLSMVSPIAKVSFRNRFSN